MTSVGSVELQVKIALDQLKRDAAKANAELLRQIKDIEVKVNVDSGSIQKAVNDVDRSSRLLDGIFQGIGQQITGTVIGSIQQATQALQQLTQQAIGAAVAFDSARAKVATLSKDADGVAASMRELSKELGQQVSSTDLLNASYDVLSSGFSDAADITKILKASFLGAQGGFSDVGTVADATTTILNSYKLSAEDAARVVDVLAQTQDKGKITIGQYAQQIGKAASIASQAGIGLEEFSAAVATATAKGVPAESSISGTRQAIVNLLKPTADAQNLLKQFGIENSAAALKSKGLVGILEQLAAAGASTDQLSKIFSDIDAFSTVATLAGSNLKDFNANLDAMNGAAGKAAKSAEQVANSVQGQMNAAVVKANEALVELGQALLPVQAAFTSVFSAGIEGAVENSKVTEILKNATEEFNKTLEQNPEILAKMSDALGRIADVLATGVANGLGLLADYLSSDNFAQNVEALVQTFEALGAVLNFLTSSSKALSVAFSPVQKQFETLQVFAQVLGGLANAMSALVSKAQELGGALADLPVIKQLREAIGIAQQLIDQLGLIGSAPAQAQGGLAAAVQEAGQKAVQETKPAAKPAAKPATTTAETPAKAETKSLKDQLDEQVRTIEAGEAAKTLAVQQAREAGKKTEEQANAEILKIQRDSVAQQIAFVQERLKGVKKGSDDEALLTEQLTKLKTEQGTLAAKAAEASNKQQEQSAKDALKAQKDAVDNLERSSQRAAQAVERSQSQRILAIKQAQLAGTIGEKEAQRQIEAIQQDGIRQNIAAKQKEIADVRSLRQRGLIDAQDAADREAALVGDIAQLNQQRIDGEIAAQKQLREEALKTLELQRNGKLDLANQALGQQSAGLQTDANLQSVRTDLVQSRADLSLARLQTQIETAKAAGDEAKAARLQEEYAKREASWSEAIYDNKLASLEISQKLKTIDSEREINSAKIAANEAEIALIKAQTDGASTEELQQLQRILDLRNEAVGQAEEAAKAQQTINQWERESLANQQQINREKFRQGEIQRKNADAEKNAGEPARRLVPGSKEYRQQQIRNSGGRINASGSSAASRLGEALKTGVKAPALTTTGLGLKTPGLTQAALQQSSDTGKNAVELGTNTIKVLTTKLDQLIRATQEASGRPSLTINRQDDIATAGKIYSDIAKSNLRAAGL